MCAGDLPTEASRGRGLAPMVYVGGDAQFEEAMSQWRASQISDAELVACYLSRWVSRRQGTRAFQGKWGEPFAGHYDGRYVQALSERRLWKAEREAISALLAWSKHERAAVLYFRKLASREVLALQAQGFRCVSLLDDETHCGMFEDGYDFTRHDLCHLEKFFAPEVYWGQIGFCHALLQALSTPAWHEVEQGFDEIWERDRDYVFSDMNGSVVFLVSMLKMKVKMAVRRANARSQGLEHERSGALTDEEIALYRPKEDALLTSLALPREIREAATVVTTTREHHTQAQQLCDYFEHIGRRECRANVASLEQANTTF